MDNPTGDDFAHLEAEVAKDPTSEDARENLLEALSADLEHFNDPRRFELIAWFLQHNPRHHICTTPFMRVNPESAPDAYGKLKARWLALVADAPADPQLVRGAAAFVAAQSLDDATRLLRAALVAKPDDARLWLDLGRMSQDPRERLVAFEKARDAGETLPNLLVWIATASFKADDYAKAERASREFDAPRRRGTVAFWRQARLARARSGTLEACP